MPFYLVKAKPKKEKLPELEQQLQKGKFKSLKPFGKALSYSLENARWWDSDTAAWEEEDYCSPPLKEEKAAVLDTYFDDIELEKVMQGQGWQMIEGFPKLFEVLHSE